ncbi:RNA helicase [Lentinula aciculospora]|uniref:RNA helicase n=1 Tax=Lentinula aciculospora TaxID=153920 RepID=A0A9W8ZU87_9AGAR|nr:RNA helicase [Lentinula aciculospora]
MAPALTKLCYDSLEGRGCPRGSTCNLQHDILKCTCGLVLRRLDFHGHVNGKRHFKFSRRATNGDRSALSIVGEAEIPSNTSPLSSGSASTRCPRCNKHVPQSQYHHHLKTHDLQKRLDSALEVAESNKHGFTIDGLGGVDFGIIGEEQTLVVRLKITRESEPQPPPIRLSKCRLLSSSKSDQHGRLYLPDFRFSVDLVGSPLINPGHPRTLLVTFHPSCAGRYENRLELVFRNRATKTRFVIHRRLLATVGDSIDHAQLQPSAPYTRRKRVPLNVDGPIRRSVRPPTWTKTGWVTVLPKFDMPRQITDTLHKRGAKSRKDVLALVKGLLAPDFNIRTRSFLLFAGRVIDGFRYREDLDAYAMEGVSLTPKHPRYELEVQGLAENRPSVLVGDFILVRQCHASDRTWFQGRVHQVYENYVSLRFDDSFSTYRGNSFEVRFVLNRLSLRRMHAALINNNNPIRLLFPGPEHIRGMRTISSELIKKIVPVNRVIGQDPEQLEAVAAIVNLPPGSVPFVIFGPPGTGKTVTIVEAMRQLLAYHDTTRLLVCAPSNSAADLLTQKLSDLGPSVVLRLNALSRKLSELPKNLRDFSIINDNEMFAMPTVQKLRTYRVVVSTCITAGVPASLGIERGYYSHIFVDEAGQAMEPTVMVPLKELADAMTNIVLAGDNKQLGPIVHSRFASVLGLKTSYLARIMERDVYNLDGKSSVGGRGVTIIKLVRNFRSHPAILEFSNEHFYNHELQYCGSAMLTRSLEESDELPKKKFPLIFHGIIGKDLREASSPSFFNIEEASQVKKYCLNLISDRKNGIRAEHIAVITPYHAQRIKIMKLLSRHHAAREIKVGSVEEFQGQERRIVIISTVRSSTNFIGADINRMLGFVASPHRFNVAVTRAQALLIVVGNPAVLSLDPLWRAFLNYIYRGGGWRGKTISWDPEGAVDLSNGQGYDEEARQRASGEAEETINRLKALIIRKNGEIENGFQFELDDSDEEDSHFGFGEGAVFREDD